MKCINEDIGNLISFYEFDQLSEEQKQQFEWHLLQCDFCFQRLYELSPVVLRMRKKPRVFLEAVQEDERPALFKKIRNTLEEFFTSTRKVYESLPTWGKGMLPAGIAVVVLLLILLPPSGQLTDLARIEPVPYRPLQTKGGSENRNAEQLFEEGMRFYVQKKYQQAVVKLALAVERNPENVSFQFYLGLSYLLAGEMDQAIEHFENTIELDGNSLLERAHWYLGNAYLLKGERSRALQEFQKVVEIEGRYERKAREMIERLQR